jgi:cytidyltransferase-like protein
VIVATADLGAHRGAVTMVDGAFDPIHVGHVAYFEAAAALGQPVLCNVSPDEYDSRKHRPLLPQAERAAILDAIRFVDYVHLSAGTTESVLRALVPHTYAKGADWRGRLPAEEVAACAELGIRIAYLDTVLDSSTAVLERYASEHGD